MSSEPVLCVPMHLQAFILNNQVAAGSEAKIAPITQPNYTFLRFNENLPASDVLDHVDLHYTSPASRNSRVTDLGRGTTRDYRLGAYLSWTLPRFYRSGVGPASANDSDTPNTDSPDPNASANKDSNAPKTDSPSPNVPKFRTVPTRWLVVRKIDTSNLKPVITDKNVLQKLQYNAWVIESNRVWTIADLDAADDANQAKNQSKPGNFVPLDLQVDVSPYVYPQNTNDKATMQLQSEIFLGCKTELAAWTPDASKEADGKRRFKPLTLLDSSNPLFADFQHHNSNCFSMLDNFAYIDSNGDLKHLTSANASYYVIGWHPDPSEDPLAIAGSAKDRKSNLNLVFNGTSDDIDKWLKKSKSTICHGALYNVKWNRDVLPSNIPAKVVSELLNKDKPNEPLALGTTPTDALLAYISAHQDSNTGDLKELEQDIWNLRTLLVAQNDSADALLAAHDQLYDYGFERSDGGREWHFSGDETALRSSLDTVEILSTLNVLQDAVENTTRTIRYLQWQLFSIWWRLVTGAASQKENFDSVKNNEVLPLVQRLKTLKGTSKDDLNTVLWLKDQIKSKLQPQTKSAGPPKVEKAAAEPFFLAKDPTLLIGGISSGWPADYLDALACRMDGELTSSSPVPPEWSSFVSSYIPQATPKLPKSIQAAVGNLLAEFARLESSAAAVDGGPLYHDQGPKGTSSTLSRPFRDRWDGQPFCPLFVEWEAEYYHIPYADWDLDPTTSVGNSNTHPMLQYGIDPKFDLSKLYKAPSNIVDVRIFKGRALLLPQPGFSLQNSITQLLNKMSDDDLKAVNLSGDERKFLNQNMAKLPYLSVPLSGFRNHLLTRSSGSHVKPLQRTPGQNPSPMDAAVTDKSEAAVLAGFNASVLQNIGTQSGLTPYGRGIESLAAENYEKFPIFKPVTHGQFRFKHLNVIDKFGQAVCAIDPTPSNPRQHICPALADNYKVQARSDGKTPNVVMPDVAPPNNEFAQLAPSINQPARINASPIVPDLSAAGSTGKPRWRPASEWENAVYGWVVNNYEDNSLQLFLNDGTFYREVTLGGMNGSLTSPAWIPFQQPAGSTASAQLDQLVAKLNDKSYLKAFMDMINSSSNDLPPAPSSFAQYMTTIVSKPLALVNLGWSLELSHPPLHNESVLSVMEPDMTLLDPNPTLSSSAPSELPCGRDSSIKIVVPPKQTRYTFPLKIGDAERTYDGLIGYFLPPNPSTAATSAAPFDLSKVYTYWPSSGSKTTVQVDHKSYLPLQAFHVSPDTMSTTTPGTKPSTPPPTILKSPETIASERNSNLYVVSALVDPFTKIHAFSGILPVQSLQLPK